jgi:hypothetical protein
LARIVLKRTYGAPRQREAVEVDENFMHRTIAAAAIVFAFAAFALHSAALGPFEEPLLLLGMGTLFLVAGKLFAPERRTKPRRLELDADSETEPAPQLVPHREARSG